MITVLWAFLFVIETGAQNQTAEDETLAQLVFDYGIKGYDSYNSGNLDSAQFYLLKALDLQYSNARYSKDDRVAINHVTLASIYRIIYNNKGALEHLNKAEEIMNSTDPTNILFATIYHNKGNIFKTRNDIYRTREYYEYALDFCTRNGYQNTESFSFVFSNYINLLFELEEFELAERQLEVIDINSLKVSPLIEFRIHITNATSYSKLGIASLAEYHFREAKKLLHRKTGAYTDITEVTKYYYSIIDFYILYGEYEKALAECSRAILFIESIDHKSTKSKTIYQTDILYRSASAHYRQGNIDQALMITTRGIDNLTIFLNNLSIGNTHTSSRNEYTSALPELFILRSQILLQKFNKSSSIENLIAAFDSYQKAIETLNYQISNEQ